MPADDPGENSAQLPTRALGAVAVLLALAVGTAALVDPPAFHIVWLDREMHRAAHYLTDWIVAGAEMNHGVGARVPGGTWYGLLWPVVAAGGDAIDVLRSLLGLDVLATAVLAGLAWRRLGPLAAGVVALVYVTPVPAREAMTWLWNPTVVPFFAATGLAVLSWALRGEDPRRFAAFGLVVGLGAHVHMTVLFWGVWLVLALALLRRRAAVPGVGWTGVGLLVTYVPYVLAELSRGAPNTRALAVQSPILDAQRGRLLSPDLQELIDSARFLLPAQPGPREVVVVALVVLGLVAAAPAVRASAGTTRELLLLTAAGVVGTVLQVGLSPSVPVEWRYVLVALPGVALIAGAGWGWALGQLRPGVERLAGAVVLLSALGLTPLSTLEGIGVTRQPQITELPALTALVHDLAERWGVSPREATGRLALAERRDGRWTWMQESPMLHLLGDTRPVGSGPPPCAIALHRPPPEPRDAVAELMMRDVERVDVLATWTLPDGAQVVTFDLRDDDRRCPSSLSNRYLSSPGDDVLLDAWTHATPGAPTLTRDGDAIVVIAPRPREDPRIVVRAGIEAGEPLALSLDSPQLRGHAYNKGWFQDALVRDLAVAFEPLQGDAPSTHRTLHRRPVGISGVVMPLRLDVEPPVGAGPWRVRLTGRIHDVPRNVPDSRDVTDEPTPFDVVLFDRWPRP